MSCKTYLEPLKHTLSHCRGLVERVHSFIQNHLYALWSVKGGNGSLKLIQITGKWNNQSERNTLDGITFEAKHGQLTAIVGPVGSGKGSIFQAILGTNGNYQGRNFGIPAII